jgi:Holliday junction resolvasome RuvABC endonuclease subunit
MKFLGIDQSYNSCGIILVDDNQPPGDETTFIAKRVALGEDIFEKSWELSQQIVHIVKQYKPEHIAIEGLAFGMRGSATRDLAGLQFSIINNLRYQSKYKGSIDIISPLTLKKFATGSGKAKKEDMVAALPEPIRTEFTDLGFKKTTGMGDLADAFWLAKYIQHKYKH